MRIVILGSLDQWLGLTTAARRGPEQLFEAPGNAPFIDFGDPCAHRTLRSRI
jgi:hypothetical protein